MNSAIVSVYNTGEINAVVNGAVTGSSLNAYQNGTLSSTENGTLNAIYMKWLNSGTLITENGNTLNIAYTESDNSPESNIRFFGDMVIHENIMYISSPSTNRIFRVNIQNPLNLVTINSFDTNVGSFRIPTRLEIYQNYLIVLSAQDRKVRKYDLNNMTNDVPAIYATTASTGNELDDYSDMLIATNLGPLNDINLVFMVDERSDIYQANLDDGPTWNRSVSYNMSVDEQSPKLAINDDKSFLFIVNTAQNAVKTITINPDGSGLTNPVYTYTNSIDMPEPYDIKIQNNNAYVSNASKYGGNDNPGVFGLTVLNISDPTLLTIVGYNDYTNLLVSTAKESTSGQISVFDGKSILPKDDKGGFLLFNNLILDENIDNPVNVFDKILSQRIFDNRFYCINSNNQLAIYELYVN